MFRTCKLLFFFSNLTHFMEMVIVASITIPLEKCPSYLLFHNQIKIKRSDGGNCRQDVDRSRVVRRWSHSTNTKYCRRNNGWTFGYTYGLLNLDRCTKERFDILELIWFFSVLWKRSGNVAKVNFIGKN